MVDFFSTPSSVFRRVSSTSAWPAGRCWRRTLATSSAEIGLEPLHNRNKLLFLIVEDNDKNRKLMRDVLHFKGYRLAEAETGEEGVRLARACHPDLILMRFFDGSEKISGKAALLISVQAVVPP